MSAVIDMSAASERREVAVAPAATAMLQVIERAARDPNIDIDKMERLLAMQERIVARQAQAAYADALARLQPTLPIIGERGSIKNNSGAVQSKYALWEDIVGIITPLLAAQGFSLSFRTANKDSKIQVTGVLAHREGHSEQTTLDLPADTSGSKNAVQAVASSVSYGKRYTAGALLNLRTGELDDDGRTAGQKPTLSDEQIANITALMTEVGADKARFLKYAKVDALDQILACNYETVVKMLEAKRARS
ncbi:MAG: hypothetical protein JWO52_1206 [Gammaproteobacteria bacterium]|nr:hypothetical protein [Gammaproteobacteria bacterium]